MKILLIGADGQLGRELRPRMSGLGSLVATSRRTDSEDLQLDLADAGRLRAVLDQVQPTLILSAAAYTAVDRAEQEKDLAFAINAQAPAIMAEWARLNDALLVHYSTDYVFDGQTRKPLTEKDSTHPINTYGASKKAGEQGIVDSGCQYRILRSSWIYASHGHNFLLTMLRLAAERPELRVVNDQFGCPTWAGNLAEYTQQLLGPGVESGSGLNGIYHCCDADTVSWHDFAQRILTAAHALKLIENMPVITPVASNEFPTPARRPAYSSLDTAKLSRTWGIDPRDLDSSIIRCLKEIRHE